MKSIFLLMLISTWLFSATLGIVIIEDKKGMLSKDAMPSIQKSLTNELSYYADKLDVKMLRDVGKEFKMDSKQGGFDYMQAFALEHQSDAIAVLEYKNGAHAILVKLFIADGTNKAKNTSVKYNLRVQKFLPKIISNKVLRLLIETGQIHENKRTL